MRFVDITEATDRKWLEDLLYYLMNKEQHDYCYALHNVEVIAVSQPFAFNGPYPIPAMTTLDGSTGQICMLLYWPIISRLSFKARVQELQHETLHIIEGHMSQYGCDLIKTYGQKIANMAMDIYVNQRLDRRQLAAEGIPGCTLEHFGFPPNLSSQEYAELLKDEYIELPHITFTDDSEGEQDPLSGTAGNPGEDFTGKGVAGVASGVIKLDPEEAILADEKVKQLIQNVTAALEAEGKAWSRGFFGADQAQFIQASQREAEVPWSMYLRAMETRNRSDFVVPSRRRPSRRHPAHFGRVRRSGLEVAFLVDTSGSMGDGELKLVDPELRGLHARGARITVIHCDAAVVKVAEYNPYEGLTEFHGRGGTDYSDALMQLRIMHPMPSFLVGFTDGWGGIERYKQTIISERSASWWDGYVAAHPEESPDGMPSLWVLPEGCMAPAEFKANVVPWGTAVVIKRDRS
jgi:predicted metal-dependent peptidase